MRLYSAALEHQAGLAFDSLAEPYDELFTDSLIGRAQRDAVWNVASRTFPARAAHSRIELRDRRRRTLLFPPRHLRLRL